jgi:omega-6 fatty acid desaturase (delta-12 desaturase)
MNRQEYAALLKKYAVSDIRKSVWQIVSTLIPYLILNWVMYLTLTNSYPYIVTLGLAFVASGFLMRLFIIFHDCTHQSFFKSRTSNKVVGHIMGVLSFTAFSSWQYSHAVHHGTVGNLSKRGMGDVWTMTVAEYKASSRSRRIGYSLYRNPLFLFVIAPVLLFFIKNRFPSRKMRRDDIISLAITNASIAGLVVGSIYTIGLGSYLAIQLPIMTFAGMIGIWLFYIQHQFDEVYWEKDESWNRERAAIEGSSYFKLPGIMRWFSGNIGYHHIHHLNPRIPNYNLKRCFENVSVMQEVNVVTFFKSFKLIFLNLYDENSRKLISFRRARMAC